MNEEIATQISLMAAPIYAQLMMSNVPSGDRTPGLDKIRTYAVRQAWLLWKATLDYKGEHGE